MALCTGDDNLVSWSGYGQQEELKITETTQADCEDFPQDLTWPSADLLLEVKEAELDAALKDDEFGDHTATASMCCSLDDDGMMAADDTDDSDPQRVAEYADDIFGKLGRDEASHRSPHPNYMKAQPDLDASVRAATVDWLVGVHMKYKLKSETLFLAVSILDRFLATRRVCRKDLQLVACTAAFIAAKFEEIEPPEVRDFAHITDQCHRKEAILGMEITMLTALEFCLCRPTAAHYLQRYKPENHGSQAHPYLLQYILELALLDLRMTRFVPSLQAAAASMVSSRVLNLNDGRAVLAGQTERVQTAVQRCAGEMCKLLQDAEWSSGEVKRKFSSAEFGGIATSACLAI